MDIIRFPDKERWAQILARPHFDNSSLTATVSAVIDDVRARGDAAVREYEAKFDNANLESLLVSEAEFEAAEAQVDDELRGAIVTAAHNIAAFHSAQDTPLPSVETMPGVRCWQQAVPIDRVGLYIPGGTAPLFSTVLMLALPAKLAGCPQIVMCTPPRPDGTVNPIVAYAAKVAGVSKLYKIGGVQAIAAMAYGTESVPRVYKIFGPGNQYVTAAKQIVSLSQVAIDMPAGPSEVEVIADETANPRFVAADLLSQAEHGADSQAILITSSPDLAQKVSDEVERQLDELSRRELTAKSLQHSKIIVVRNLDEVIDITNDYAPEHLIIQTADPRAIADQIRNAGSLFLGHLTPESAGDYASGTNHTLPTSGYAHAYNGVNLDSFRKKMTYQEITPEGIRNIASTVEVMARNEQLTAHEAAMRFRRQDVEARSSADNQPSFDPLRLVRPNIAALKPYACARTEFKGKAKVFVDANENPYTNGVNRYPDPFQTAIKAKLAKIKGVAEDQIVLGNGSDEPIDLIYRIFCRPRIDNVVAIEPTYGMYRVQADINDVEYRTVNLDNDFSLNADRLLAATDAQTKVVWLCSPNNPSGNLLNQAQIRRVVEQFRGIVVIDEAYIDFAPEASWLAQLNNHPNLIVLQTFSKAWGLAGVRCGLAFASRQIIQLFNNVKYPYNVNCLTQERVLKALDNIQEKDEHVKVIIAERRRMAEAFANLPTVQGVYPSDANFLLVHFDDATRVYKNLLAMGIVTRNRHRVTLCANCVRITIGMPSENDEVLKALQTL
ncbi:MAG: histidinol dehydrogenase [Bacteroidales bacterium]|nr:histidinol dehydrogenase [Bacteroidales bacterium]